ncbi:MAG: AAA family ATPase [Gemmatimonadetes bacterium]|nr:AAA family ATPase [Gemmatimonadota bacterium]
MNPPRVPPHDDAAERALLGALLLDARLPDQVLPQLGDADFYRPAHRRIAAAMATLVADGVPVELLGLCDVLRRHGELEACGGQEYLAMLLDDAVTSANIAAPLRLVQEHAARRALLDRMHHASEAVQSGELSAEALRTTLVSDLLGMSPDRSRAGFRPLPVHAVCDEIERRGRGEGSGLRLGWPEFDRQAQGLQAGEVVLICGAPKVGKSTVAAQCGMHVALSGQGGVGYVSAEMSSEAITERLLAALAGVPIGAMRAGTLTDAQYRRLAEASTALFRAPFWIDDGAVPRLQDIVARVLALKAQHPTLARSSSTSCSWSATSLATARRRRAGSDLVRTQGPREARSGCPRRADAAEPEVDRGPSGQAPNAARHLRELRAAQSGGLRRPPVSAGAVRRTPGRYPRSHAGVGGGCQANGHVRRRAALAGHRHARDPTRFVDPPG